jgi:hypothetical protein
LSSDAFPSLDVLELDIRHASDSFFRKMFESFQREISTPIKRIKIYNHLAKENLEALLMVPVEELNLY